MASEREKERRQTAETLFGNSGFIVPVDVNLPLDLAISGTLNSHGVLSNGVASYTSPGIEIQQKSPIQGRVHSSGSEGSHLLTGQPERVDRPLLKG